MQTQSQLQIKENSPDTKPVYCALCGKNLGTVKFKGHMVCHHCLEHVRAIH